MVSGASVEELKSAENSQVLGKVLLHSILFISGFSIVFISLGASASWLGQALLSRMTLLYKVAGIIIIIFGLHLTGLLRIGFLYKDKRFHSVGKPATALGALLIGLAARGESVPGRGFLNNDLADRMGEAAH